MSQNESEWYSQGLSFYQEAKYEDAISCFDNSISLKSDFGEAYYCKGLCLVALGRAEEALEVYSKAISAKPDYVMLYYAKGICLLQLNRHEAAIEAFDEAVALEPENAEAHYGKGSCFYALNRKDEACECYSKAASFKPTFDAAFYCKGNCLFDLGNNEEALNSYNEAITLTPNNALYLCSRGKCLLALDRQAEATEDFKKAHSLLESGNPGGNLLQAHIDYVKTTLESVLKLEEMSSKAEEAVKTLNQDNPEAQGFVARLRALQQKKNLAAIALLKDVDKKDEKSDAAAAQKVQDEYMKEFEMLRKEMEDMKEKVNKIDQDLAEIKVEIKDIKAELANKMDDFHKKLDNELAKSEMSPEDQAKIREYFTGFIQTFSSTFVTSQVIESGQVELSVGNNSTDIVSVVASFVPFIGNVLSSGITSVTDFLNLKEMKTNARKIKGLAADSTALSQLVGKSAFDIATDSSKQQKILATTDESLEETSGNLFQKVAEICQIIDQGLDIYIYSQLYQSPQSRLGHMDANKLIGIWIENKIPPYNVSARFVQIIIQEEESQNKSAQLEGAESKGEQKESSSSSSSFKCGECNIF